MQSIAKHMNTSFRITLLIAGCAFHFASALAQSPAKGLKDYYKDYFPVGVAVSPRSLQSTDEAPLILAQFNSLTAENAMKMGPIHPEENRFNWKDADSIAAFAQRHHLKMRGHVLCWHEQTPDWLFKDAEGQPVTKEVLLKRLETHITAIVSRYKGQVYGWDVVNEAIDDDSTRFLRETPWLQICGEEFIAKAFEYAHRADPQAVLFYNDYNAVRPEKRERIYQLLKKLKDNGVPIHGMGIQGHWSVFEPNERDLRAAIERYASLGLQVQITELDLSVYRWEKFQRPRHEDEKDAFTPEIEQQQMDQYKMIFKVFRDYKKEITGVTFWNISDRHTWLDFYPVRGRKNYPLLFDQNLQPKKVYWEVVKF